MEVIVGEVFEGFADPNRGVVDQHVHPAQFGGHPIHHRGDFRAPGDVGPDVEGAPSALLADGVGGLRAPVIAHIRNSDIIALARQLQRDFPSQTPGARRAGYDRYFLVRHGLPRSRTAFSVAGSVKAARPFPEFAISTHLDQA